MFSQIDRQIVRAWRERLIDPHLSRFIRKGPRPTGPRIAVIGNCQAFGLAYAMKLYDPSAHVAHFSAVGRSLADIGLIARTLSGYDYVFSYEFLAAHARGGGSDRLRELLDRVILVPTISFSGFHPDLVYLMDATRGHAHTNGLLGPYHSALAVFAFRRGLSLDEAHALFNANVMEAVGYFDVWNEAAAEFIETSKRKFDLDFSRELANWTRRGVFMYSIVHPKPHVLFDVARKLLAREGLPTPALDADYYALDDLARADIYPVYPPIAERYGVTGSYIFKLRNYRLWKTVGELASLRRFLSESYEVYRRARPAQIAHPRVEAWLDDPAAVGRILTLARENLRAGLLPA